MIGTHEVATDGVTWSPCDAVSSTNTPVALMGAVSSHANGEEGGDGKEGGDRGGGGGEAGGGVLGDVQSASASGHPTHAAYPSRRGGPPK